MDEKNYISINYSYYLENPTKIFFRENFINSDMCNNVNEILYEDNNILFFYKNLQKNVVM